MAAYPPPPPPPGPPVAASSITASVVELIDGLPSHTSSCRCRRRCCRHCLLLLLLLLLLLGAGWPVPSEQHRRRGAGVDERREGRPWRWGSSVTAARRPTRSWLRVS